MSLTPRSGRSSKPIRTVSSQRRRRIRATRSGASKSAGSRRRDGAQSRATLSTTSGPPSTFSFASLYSLNGAATSDGTGFPIWKSQAKYESGRPGVANGISKAALDILYALKPYQGGNDALWHLHRLDIADKHRLLLAVGAVHQNVILPSPAMGEFLAGALSITLGVADRQFPLKDRTEIFRVAKAAREEGDQDYDDLKFTFEIALNEPGVIEGEPVLPALHELADLVKGIVAAFDPLLS